MELKIEYVPIDTIRTYENNAKIHTAEQIEQIKKSIQEFGMNDPIALWHDTIVKDLSKADVSVNIYAHLLAQKTGKTVELHCAIGDNTIDGKPYSEIVGLAREYINNIGGFEKFSEWGLI